MGVPPWYLIVLLSIYYRDDFGYIFVRRVSGGQFLLHIHTRFDCAANDFEKSSRSIVLTERSLVNSARGCFGIVYLWINGS
jgi:hypothetical protein